MCRAKKERYDFNDLRQVLEILIEATLSSKFMGDGGKSQIKKNKDRK